MRVYLDVLVLLNFFVDFLLLVGTNRLSGYPASVKRAAIGAAVGGVYAGACVLPGLYFLGHLFWRLAVLFIIGGLCFGFRKSSFRRTVVFFIFSMALGGVASALGRKSFLSVLLAAGGLCAAAVFAFRGRVGERYIPVEIPCQGGALRLTALVDTGNLLTDPITGQQILIASSRVGCKLLNLTQNEMADPVRVITKVPGSRLVPIETVGREGGMLPVKRYNNVKVGINTGSYLIAFSGHDLGSGQQYDLLIGG